MERRERIARIRKEIRATTVISYEGVVGYEDCLEPNPAMHISEGANYPTTADGEHIIVSKPVSGIVMETVPDRARVVPAAEELVGLVLADEGHIDLAEELMTGNDLFIPAWERLYREAHEKKTRRIAARHLGRSPVQRFMKRMEELKDFLETPLAFAGRCAAGLLAAAFIVSWLWPRSPAGLWIARTAKTFVGALQKMFWN